METLLKSARAAQKNAYAPYSKFKVGAALRDEEGKIHAGCNIENAAYPQGWCAETSAIAHLISSGAHKIMEVVIVGTGEALCTPCGGCRQKLREFAAPTLKIHCFSETGQHKQSFTLDELLPSAFGPDNLL